MKNYLLLFLVAFLLNACSDKNEQKTAEPVQTVKSIELSQVLKDRPEYTISLTRRIKTL